MLVCVGATNGPLNHIEEAKKCNRDPLTRFRVRDKGPDGLDFYPPMLTLRGHTPWFGDEPLWCPTGPLASRTKTAPSMTAAGPGTPSFAG